MGTPQPQSEMSTGSSVANGGTLEAPLTEVNPVVEKEKISCEVSGEFTSASPSAEVNKTNDEEQNQILENGVCSVLAAKGSIVKVNGTIPKPLTRRATVNDLPDEIIIKIFSYLSFGELLDAAQKVSPRWKRLSQDVELWYDKIYVISWCNTNSNNRRSDKTDDEAIYTLTNVPQLRTVLMQRGVKSNVFRALYSNCRNLTNLQIGAAQKLSYSVMKNLVEKCSKLQTLRMSNYLLQRPKFVHAVAGLQHLRVLSLEEYCSNDTEVNFLRPLSDGCPQLAEVDLGHMYYRMEDLRYFLTSKKDKLKYLGLRWTMENKRCVAPLLPIVAETLERLELYQYDVNRDEAREAFIALGQLTNLRELTSMNLTAPLTGIVPLAFKDGGLSKLRLLDLWDALGMEDEAVIAICRSCPLLRELRLRNALRVTDAGFAQIHRLKYLQILDVSTCEGLGSGLMPHVAKLPNLRALLMEEMEFSKMLPGLMSILEIGTLRCLNLSSSKISPIPFDKFPSRLAQLRELHIENCEGDRKVIEELHEKMPKLQIYGNVRERAPSTYWDSDLSDYDSDGDGHHEHVGHGAGHVTDDDNSESYCESDTSSDSEDFDVALLFPEHARLELDENW